MSLFSKLNSLNHSYNSKARFSTKARKSNIWKKVHVKIYCIFFKSNETNHNSEESPNVQIYNESLKVGLALSGGHHTHLPPDLLSKHTCHFTLAPPSFPLYLKADLEMESAGQPHI